VRDTILLQLALRVHLPMLLKLVLLLLLITHGQLVIGQP
jgi:hypothetical protein